MYDEEEEDEEDVALRKHIMAVNRELVHHANQMADFLEDRETFWHQILMP